MERLNGGLISSIKAEKPTEREIDIYQCYVDMDNEWLKISKERFIELTEGRGYYKKDTALKVLIQMKRMRTDFSYFKYEFSSDAV